MSAKPWRSRRVSQEEICDETEFERYYTYSVEICGLFVQERRARRVVLSVLVRSADVGVLRDLASRSGCEQTLWPGRKRAKIERLGRIKKVEDLFDTGRSFPVNMRRFIGSVHLWV